jgi:hypothetical protein
MEVIVQKLTGNQRFRKSPEIMEVIFFFFWWTKSFITKHNKLHSSPKLDSKFNKKQNLDACIKTTNQNTPSSTAKQTPQHTTQYNQRSKKHIAPQLKKNQNKVTATTNILKAMNLQMGSDSTPCPVAGNRF